LKGFWKADFIYVTEKIDGSQFSFGVTDDGDLICRSRRRQIDLAAPGMFKAGVDTAQDLAAQGMLNTGWTYRGEYLSKPKHNTMVYERVPKGNIILFDVDRGDQDYLTPYEVLDVAEHLDLEAVPVLAAFRAKPDMGDIKGLLGYQSVLGNGTIEGVVLKNYGMYDEGKKVLMAKMVSEDFVERHSKSWKKRNPSRKDFIADLTDGLATEACWTKAVQHCREAGEIEGIPQDIPTVMREICRDTEKEMRVEIQDALWHHFWPQIRRGLTKGLPEFYKALLAEEAME
jgi:hypothetical protein